MKLRDFHLTLRGWFRYRRVGRRIERCMAEQRERAAEDPTQDMNRPEPSGDEPLDLSEPEDLGESGPFEERSAPRTKADLLREIRQRADRRTGQQEAEQRQIDPWQAQPPQRRGHGR